LTDAFDGIQDSLNLKEDLYFLNIPSTIASNLDRGNASSLLSSHITNVNEGCCFSVLAPIYVAERDGDDSLPGLVGMSSFSSYIVIMKQSLLQERTSVELNFVQFIEGQTTPSSSSIQEDSETEIQDESMETEFVSRKSKAPTANDLLYVVQIDFYDFDHLFVLLRDTKGNSFIARIPVFILLEGSFPDDSLPGNEDVKNISFFPPSVISSVSLTSDLSTPSAIHYRKIPTPSQKWTKLAVSGVRRVACISSLRKVKVFETDVGEGEDDDDEDDMETNAASTLNQTTKSSTLDTSSSSA
jgi:hypothetical protein